MENKIKNDNEYVYVVVSQTGTILSLILKFFTKAKYNHASISLDNKLDEMYSFGRKYPYNVFLGALVKEHPSFGTFKRFYKTTCQILKLKVTKEQKDCIEKTVKSMYENRKEYKFILGVKVPITTLCPCSKEISKYSAHNQRTMVKVKVSYSENDIIWIEDLVEKIESCGSSQVYSILKRCDEKYVTETAYENPKFVEDVLRDVICLLKDDPKITYYQVEVEAQESIHNHNAWAFQTEDKLAGDV